MLRRLTLAVAAVAAVGLLSSARAQTGYGVTSEGTLFRFNVKTTTDVTNVGTLPFVPEGIDFRPGTNLLYALDVGPETTQLYVVNTFTGAATPVGDGFPSQVSGQPSGNYSLLGATVGFDFNPRTLQADGSVRIRVVASNRANLRLNSDTGEVAAVDTRLGYPEGDPNAGATPMVDAAAYLNSARSTAPGAGTTTLYVLDFGTDDLATQNPPNAGQLNTVGSFGVTVNADPGIGFDIFTDPSSADDGIGGDLAFAVLKRPDAPTGDEGSYLLYDVNLSTGQLTGGRLVGGGFDFTGGFAVQGFDPDALVISEFRLRGPNGANDEFVEIQNIGADPFVVNSLDGSAGYGVAASDGTTRCTVPNGTVIPARGHYLCVNSVGYSLASYRAGAGTTATGDATYTTDIPDNAGLAIFNNSTGGESYTLANRLDAVGSTSEANTLYREGAGVPAVAPEANVNHSFYRDNCGKSGSVTTFGTCPYGGNTKDTDNNATDFIFVDTTGSDLGFGQRLGAPGPENLSSAIQSNASFAVQVLDPCVSINAPPNRVRDFTTDAPNNSAFGTLDIRKTVTNNTGAPVTKLRWRIIDITTFPAPSGYADLRPRTSTAVVVTVDRAPCGAGTSNVVVQGTTLEQPPSQPNSGGFNSSLDTDTVSLETPLAEGASIDVRFLLGIQQTGIFKFYINVEAVTSKDGDELPAAPRTTLPSKKTRWVSSEAGSPAPRPQSAPQPQAAPQPRGVLLWRVPQPAPSTFETKPARKRRAAPKKGDARTEGDEPVEGEPAADTPEEGGGKEGRGARREEAPADRPA